MKQCGLDPSALPTEEKGIVWHSVTAAFLRDLYCRKVSGVQAAEQIVIISLSVPSAPDLSNDDGEARFDVNRDWMPVILKQSIMGQLESEQLLDHGPGFQKLFWFDVWVQWNQGLCEVTHEHTVYFTWPSTLPFDQ